MSFIIKQKNLLFGLIAVVPQQKKLHKDLMLFAYEEDAERIVETNAVPVLGKILRIPKEKLIARSQKSGRSYEINIAQDLVEELA